jgi:predicted phosphate transport protein (TIGR00153 family)
MKLEVWGLPLTKLRNFLVPQDTIFFDLMERQAKVAHAASQELSVLFRDYRGAAARARKIRELEYEGDQLMREVYTALNRTFIVPIDHSDISVMASLLDDVLDLADHTSHLLLLYEIKAPTPAMAELSSILARQTRELQSAVAAINSARTYAQVSGHFIEIKRLESKADDVYTHAVAALFRRKDAIEVLKQKEILDCLESAIDKAEKAAHHVSDIVMKHS